MKQQAESPKLSEVNYLETLDAARGAYAKLNTAWWKLYMDKGSRHPDTMAASAAASECRQAAIAKFGVVNEAYPDCEECRAVSVFSGPGHEVKNRCKSGRRPHCSCPICWS